MQGKCGGLRHVFMIVWFRITFSRLGNLEQGYCIYIIIHQHIMMIKNIKHLIFINFLLLPFLVLGQSNNNLHKFSFTLECRGKLDKSRSVHPNAESLNSIEQKEWAVTGSLLISYKINSKFGIETGYSFEPYNKGLALKSAGNFPVNYLLAHNIPLRLSYLFKRNLIFEPAIGIITSFRHNDGDIGGDGGGLAVGPSLILMETDRKGIEYDVNRVTFLVDTRAQIRYEFSKSFALFIGGGYSQGTRIIGRVNAMYTKPPSTTVYYIKKEYRGSNVYLNSGFRISLAGVKSDK